MSLKIPVMQYDKTINPTEGMKLIEFAEQYVNSFKDDMAERTIDKVISSRFLGKAQYEILMKRRENFSEGDIEDPENSYVNRYRKVITKLLAVTEYARSNSGFSGITGFSGINSKDLPKLKDMLDFFTNQGYLTIKQIGLIHFLTSKCSTLSISLPVSLNSQLENLLHHHIKKDFMKVETITELAEILTDIKEKTEKAQPKKKMFFSLSQIRSELSN